MSSINLRIKHKHFHVGKACNDSLFFYREGFSHETSHSQIIMGAFKLLIKSLFILFGPILNCTFLLINNRKTA